MFGHKSQLVIVEPSAMTTPLVHTSRNSWLQMKLAISNIKLFIQVVYVFLEWHFDQQPSTKWPQLSSVLKVIF
jgi:hypothetical protein